MDGPRPGHPPAVSSSPPVPNQPAPEVSQSPIVSLVIQGHRVGEPFVLGTELGPPNLFPLGQVGLDHAGVHDGALRGSPFPLRGCTWFPVGSTGWPALILSRSKVSSPVRSWGQGQLDRLADHRLAEVAVQPVGGRVPTRDDACELHTLMASSDLSAIAAICCTVSNAALRSVTSPGHRAGTDDHAVGVEDRGDGERGREYRPVPSETHGLEVLDNMVRTLRCRVEACDDAVKVDTGDGFPAELDDCRKLSGFQSRLLFSQVLVDHGCADHRTLGVPDR
jgi:hypothetical protein